MHNWLVLSVEHTLAWCMDNLLFYGPSFPRSDLVLIEKGIKVISLAKLRQGCQNLEKGRREEFTKRYVVQCKAAMRFVLWKKVK